MTVTYRWVVDADHPGGHLVAMTAAEEAQAAADAAAGQAAAAAAVIVDANAATIVSAIGSRLPKLRAARTALAGGTVFASLSVNEKAVIDGLLEDDLYLARLMLRLLDGTA